MGAVQQSLAGEGQMTDAQLPVRHEELEDADTNSSSNPSFDSVVQARLSRRQVLGGTAGVAAMAMLGGMKVGPVSAQDMDFNSQFPLRRAPRLGFTPVP